MTDTDQHGIEVTCRIHGGQTLGLHQMRLVRGGLSTPDSINALPWHLHLDCPSNLDAPACVNSVTFPEEVASLIEAGVDVITPPDMFKPTPYPRLRAPRLAPEWEPPKERRIQIAVEYLNQSTRYYPVPPGEGWKVDAEMRCLVVGRGVPRTLVPLDSVASFAPTEYWVAGEDGTP